MKPIKIGSYSAESEGASWWRVTTVRLGVVVTYRTFGPRDVVVARLARAHAVGVEGKARRGKKYATGTARGSASRSSANRWAALELEDES